MAKVLADPSRPVENWEVKLSDWLTAVEGCAKQA